MSFRPLAKANDRICNLVGSYIMAFKRRPRHLIGSCYLVAFYKMALNLEPRHLTGICYVVGFDKMASKQAICILWWLSFACDLGIRAVNLLLPPSPGWNLITNSSIQAVFSGVFIGTGASDGCAGWFANSCWTMVCSYDFRSCGMSLNTWETRSCSTVDPGFCSSSSRRYM